MGKRSFREMGRSRQEADGGIGGAFEVGSRLRLLGALSGRCYDAKNEKHRARALGDAREQLNDPARIPRPRSADVAHRT